MHLSKEEILKLSLTSQDLLEICTHVKYKSLVFFGLKLQSKIFLSRLKTRGPKGHCRSPEYNERERNVGMEPKITAVSEEKSKMSQPIRGQGGHFVFSRLAWKTQTWKKALRAYFLSSFVEFRSAVSSEKSKMSQPIRGQGDHFVFPISPKNTNLVEGVEILLPIKLRWIQFSGFRGEVENVSANQRLGGHLVFPIGPKNTNLVKGFEILLPNKFRWIGFSGFREEVENVFDILFFRLAKKTQTW